MDFRSLFARKQPATAAEIGAAIERAEAESAAACSAIDGLRDARARALLEAADAEIDRLEAELAAETRRLDRADAALIELKRRLKQAAEAETIAARDAIHDRAREAQTRGLELLRRDFAEASAKLAKIAAEIQATDDEIAELNRQLGSKGDGRRVRTAPEEVWSEFAERFREQHKIALPPSNPLAILRLPLVDWPPNQPAPGGLLWPV